MIIEKFEEQVRKFAEKPAVITGQQLLTYNRLDRLANAAAHVLLGQEGDSSKKEDNQVVGLIFEHSADMIVGVLGTLKAEKVYVPMDINYPLNRLVYILENSGAGLVLTNTANLALARQLEEKVNHDLIVINIDTIEAPMAFSPLQRTPRRDRPAYILYTSGSTGKPKGVMQTHENVCYYIRNWTERFEITHADRLTLFSAFSHDGAGQDMFGALHNGAVLYPYNILRRTNINRISQWLKKEKITVWHSVHTLYRYFIEILKEQDSGGIEFPDLRFILLGGEPIREHDIEMFKHFFPRARLANVYGQTESSVDSIWIINPQDRVNKMLIGDPLDRTELLIIDDDGTVIEDLGVGEILVACRYIAPGYWQDKQSSQQVFVNDPEIGPLYRTGDLGRLLGDANIEFLGRKDSQVKIRGFRVELGEVETALLEHPLIKETVVTARPGPDSNVHLCAYYVPESKPDSESGSSLTLRDIRKHLSGELPEYMIPSYLVELPRMPLIPNGKIDRKRLPEPGPRGTQPGVIEASPGTWAEQVLAEIWQDLLGLESVGIDDNFFELGGNSLKALGFAGKIHKRTQTEVPLAEFFDRPTIRQLARYIEGKSKKTHFSAVPPKEKREYYVLSPSQNRLYILHKMEGETIGYNLTSAVLLEGEPEMDRWTGAINQLIQRHEAFRTSFEMVEDKPVQRVHGKVKFEIEYYLTLGEREAGKKEKGMASPLEQVKNFVRPFDLSRAPLIRAGLIKKEEKQYILIVDIHHIVYDGTSMAIFYNEFMALYGGKGDELPGLRLHYKDYAEWQVSPAALAGKESREKYWLEVFSDEIPVIDLPQDFPRPPVQSYEGSRQHVILEEKVTATLKAIGRENGATLYMVLLSALNILLMKLSGQEDIVVGTVLAGRRHSDLAHIVGMFVNTLALRNYPCHDKTYKEFLLEIKKRTLGAFENQDYPFEELVEKVKVIRNASRNPLFDVMFRLHNFEAPGGDIPDTRRQGLKLSSYKFNPRTSIFDLNFGCYEADNSLEFDIDYCSALFKQETIERFAGYFREILRAVQENQDKRLSGFDILSREEKKQLLIDFNDTTVDYPGEKTLQQLFGERAVANPGHIALDGMLPHSYYYIRRNDKQDGSPGVSGSDVNVPGVNVSLTYKELDRRSDRLAGYLRGKGVVSGSVVGILVQRTVQMMVGLLGILKAGGAYIPLDPGYPAERLDYIIKNSNTGILLTQENLIRKCEELVFSGEVIDIFAGELYGEHEERWETRKMPAGLAYVIYTSGSTGNPKGVVISHGNAINFIKGMTGRIVFSPGKTIVALTTICFDIFFLETFLPLCCGLRVVIATERHQQDPLLLANLIAGHHVDILQVTPSRLKLILSASNGGGFPVSVETLIVGGEAFPLPLLKQVQERFTGNIYNVYGPTETTIWSTVKELPHGGAEQMTIGSPIANTRVYIAGRDMQLQPLGSAGDLLIGGDGVASGYLNNPELTAEKFSINPTITHIFSRNNKTFLRGPGAVFLKRAPGRRRQGIYATGDIARWLSGGEIEFLGRSDFQVKVRGFRVELEEIEEQLLKHRNIKEAVVIARDRQVGETYLCVYLVPHPPDAVSMLKTSELREFLSGHLPDYMLPSYFVLLEKIPLTPNGKIDRKALPRDEGMHLETGSTYVAPQTDLEKQVVQLCQEVLQRQERISVEDNFFDLGGNSLNLIQLNSKINETLQVCIPVITMFQYPTVRSILEYLNREAPEVTAGVVDKEIDESMEVMDETMGVFGTMADDEAG